MTIRKIKHKLPLTVLRSIEYLNRKNQLVSQHSKTFKDTYEFLKYSQWWTKNQLADYQNQQLIQLVNHAYENIPYYRKILQKTGLRPNDIKSYDDLRVLPYLTKDIIRDNNNELLAPRYPKQKLQYMTTGGTSGLPMGFYVDKTVTIPIEDAFVWRQWNWAGHKFGDKTCTIRGHRLSRLQNRKRKWWDYNVKKNELLLSSFDMTEDNLPKYIELIRKFRPEAVRGYPSSLYILSNHLKSKKIKLNGVKCIFTSSETLYPSQRELIGKYIGAQIYDHYGHAEMSALIMQCETGNYHVISEYGIVELIDKDGLPIEEEGKDGEIIATGFNNYAMPFIKYRTGDIGVYSTHMCQCGRNYPVFQKLKGRLQEFVVDKSGALFTFIYHDEPLWHVKHKITAYQFVQNEPGKVFLKIERKEKLSDDEINNMKQKFFNMYPKFEIEIEFIGNIPRTKSGKFRYLIQKLPVTFYDGKRND